MRRNVNEHRRFFLEKTRTLAKFPKIPTQIIIMNKSREATLSLQTNSNILSSIVAFPLESLDIFRFLTSFKSQNQATNFLIPLIVCELYLCNEFFI